MSDPASRDEGPTPQICENTCRRPAMARLAGLEPAATGLEGRCSIQLSYRRSQSSWYAPEDAQLHSSPSLPCKAPRRPFASLSVLVRWCYHAKKTKVADSPGRFCTPTRASTRTLQNQRENERDHHPLEGYASVVIQGTPSDGAGRCGRWVLGRS